MHRILINKDLCVGCKSCVLACMLRADSNKNIYTLDLGDLNNDSKNHIEIDKNNNSVPIICRHCDIPECVLTCMSGAMKKDKETGIVSYDKERCGVCYMCVMACPYGLLKPDNMTKQTILKCDMCESIGYPKCVANCPTGAITLQEEVSNEVCSSGC